GQLQIYAKKDQLSERDFQVYKLLDIGDFIGAEGMLFRTKTGELTVLANELTVLAKCFLPLPEKWHGLKDIEIRYRQRYVDLVVNREVRDVFVKRSVIIRELRRFLDDREYLEVETPILHPEFTMLEFYQAYSNYTDLMDLTENMLTGIAEKVCGSKVIAYDDQQIDFGKWTRLSMKEAILKFSPERIEENTLKDRAAVE